VGKKEKGEEEGVSCIVVVWLVVAIVVCYCCDCCYCIVVIVVIVFILLLKWWCRFCYSSVILFFFFFFVVFVFVFVFVFVSVVAVVVVFVKIFNGIEKKKCYLPFQLIKSMKAEIRKRNSTAIGQTIVIPHTWQILRH